MSKYFFESGGSIHTSAWKHAFDFITTACRYPKDTDLCDEPASSLLVRSYRYCKVFPKILKEVEEIAADLNMDWVNASWCTNVSRMNNHPLQDIHSQFGQAVFLHDMKTLSSHIQQMDYSVDVTGEHDYLILTAWNYYKNYIHSPSSASG